MIPVEIGNTKLLLIDTPGFDDTKRTDSDILNEIARVLAAQYALGFELKGIIYVHRITDIRYSGSNVKTFEVFKRICGDGDALKNVLLITSRWNEVDEATGAARERQLRKTFWAYMVARGSCMSRFHGDRSSAISLTSQLMIKPAVVLQLQHEMIDESKQLHETAAGSFVDDGLENRREECLREIEKLERLRDDLRENDRAMKREVEEDWARNRARLRDTEEQQVSLRRNVAGEVGDEIREETKSKSRGLVRLMPLIPAALSILGMFVGIPPGSFELLAGFVMGLPDLMGGFGE